MRTSRADLPIRIFAVVGFAVFTTAGCGGGNTSGNTATSSGNIDPAAQCQAEQDHIASLCGGASDSGVLTSSCLDSYQLYAGIGCDDEFDAWETCAIAANYDCVAGKTAGCDQQHTAYIGCQSQATLRTMCSRLMSHDAECQAPTPYAFGCVATPPSTCVQIVDGGAGVWCCPKLG